MNLSNQCVLEVQRLTVRAEQLARGTQSDRAQASALLSRAKNLREIGLSSDEIRAKYTDGIADEMGITREVKAVPKFTKEFRDYMCGRIDDAQYHDHLLKTDVEYRAFIERRDFLAGGASVSYTLGSSGGFFVPRSFYYAAVEALANVDPLLDEKNVSLIKNPSGTLTANPIDIPGWDLSGSGSTQVGEGIQQTPGITPQFSLKSLGGWMHRKSLAGTIEWEQDAFDLAMSVMARAYGVFFARGIGQQLINGTGIGQPQGLLTGAANSGYTTVTPSVAGATPIKFNDISAIYGSIDRIYRTSKKCAWVMNDVTYTAIRNAVDNSGRPLLDMADDAEMLFGRPVLISPSMPSGPNSQGIVFGDLSHYYVRVTGQQIQRSWQLSGTAGNVERGEAIYHGRMRVDAAVFDPSRATSPATGTPPIVFAVLHA
jgi:HK97 family phage major capsid protein